MGVQMLILNLVAMVAGLAVSLCAVSCTKRNTAKLSTSYRASFALLSLLLATGGLIGVLWSFLSPPPFSVEITGPPSHRRNDPERSVYLGNGCFWHTQYDTVVLEQDPQGAFSGRSDAAVTSLVGYAGGRYQSASGTACYHGLPHTDYGRLGHAEAVSISLNASSGFAARAQIAALAKVYFEHGFQSLDDGRRQRLDPQDTGAEYRNVIGLPGGMDNSELWPLIAAANVYGMKLKRGTGGTADDTEDEFVVYVYDSRRFPLFRGEAYHQFHANSVIGRAVPHSYTKTLKEVQASVGRLDDDIGCINLPFGEIVLLITFSFAWLLGLGIVFLYALLPLKHMLRRHSDEANHQGMIISPRPSERESGSQRAYTHGVTPARVIDSGAESDDCEARAHDR